MFKALNWYAEIARLAETYWQIHSFISHSGALDTYLLSHKIVSIDRDGVVTCADGSKSQLPDDDFYPDEYDQIHSFSFERESVVTNLKSAENFYNQQMIVVVSTYIEIILEDFLKVIFHKYPQRMYDFLQTEREKRGFVSLKEIVKANSLSELLTDLSAKAASNALERKFSTSLNNLVKITNSDIPRDLKSNLIDIVEKRNRIVHEASREEVTRLHVENAVNTCIDLIKFFIKISLQNDISLDTAPGDGSVLDYINDEDEIPL